MLYLWVNNAYLSYFQVTHEEIIGHKLSEIMGEKNFEGKIKPNIDKCLKGESVNFEMIMESPAYGEVVHDVNYYPLKKDKEIEGVVAIIRDTTERKKHEQELFNAK
ncbi:MAG: PAS domain-containing protein [bacterium]